MPPIVSKAFIPTSDVFGVAVSRKLEIDSEGVHEFAAPAYNNKCTQTDVADVVISFFDRFSDLDYSSWITHVK